MRVENSKAVNIDYGLYMYVCVRLILANFIKSLILGLNLISQLSSYTFEQTEFLLNIWLFDQVFNSV